MTGAHRTENESSNRPPRRRTATLLRCLIACGLIVALVATSFALRASWLPSVARWLNVGEVPRHVDYVMSLPGDENYRPFTAAAMVRLHLADQVLLVQTEASPEILDGFAMPTAELLDRIYAYCRIPDSKRIVLSGESGSTAGDIGVLAAFMQTHPDANVAVVTSDYHTRRSRWTLRRILGSAADRLTIVAAPNGDFDVDHWWHTESGFLSVTSEYIKLLAYLFVYGNAVWWLLSGFLVLAIIWMWRKRRASAAGR
jgi:uncharacterized SAM-binding protein YcdF (DUF218 family)